MKKIIKNPRKGVTLVELIVALSIITLITTVAITMMHTSIKIEVRAASIIEANKNVESIIEIFRYSDTEKEFEELCQKFFEKEQLPERSLTKVNEPDDVNDDEYYKEYKIDNGGYIIYINYYIKNTISEDETQNVGYKIEINAKHSDGKDIYNNIIFIKG